jgi:hypothetical protein
MRQAVNVTCMGREMHTKFWLESLEGRQCSEYLHIDRIILKWIFMEIGKKGVDWVHLAQDRDQWRALVDIVMNLQVP